MNQKNLLHLFDDVPDQYIMEALQPRSEKRRSSRRILLVAAVAALGCLLMGSGWALYKTWDQRDQVTGEEISRERVHLSVLEAGPRGASLEISIDGVDRREQTVAVLQGPVTLERKTQDGWEALEQLQQDLEAPQTNVLTDGEYDYSVWWGTVYGLLEPGTYRLGIAVLEGHEPYWAEFDITDRMESSGFRTAAELLEGNCYHVLYSEKVEYVPLEDATEEERAELMARQEEMGSYQYEYWKHGEDLMELTYRDGTLYMGVLYRDGVKYKLTNEDPESRLSPIAGWEVWPDYDLNRITAWTDVLLEEELEAVYNRDGSLKFVTVRTSRESTSCQAMIQITNTVEILSTQEGEISEKLQSQDVDFYRSFSWEEEQALYQSVEEDFPDVEPGAVLTASEAIAAAKELCTADYTQIRVYRDEAAGMWKVEFQLLYGHQGYRYVYLDDQGIIQRVAQAGAKTWVPEESMPFAG